MELVNQIFLQIILIQEHIKFVQYIWQNKWNAIKKKHFFFITGCKSILQWAVWHWCLTDDCTTKCNTIFKSETRHYCVQHTLQTLSVWRYCISYIQPMYWIALLKSIYRNEITEISVFFNLVKNTLCIFNCVY